MKGAKQSLIFVSLVRALARSPFLLNFFRRHTEAAGDSCMVVIKKLVLTVTRPKASPGVASHWFSFLKGGEPGRAQGNLFAEEILLVRPSILSVYRDLSSTPQNSSGQL